MRIDTEYEHRIPGTKYIAIEKYVYTRVEGITYPVFFLPCSGAFVGCLLKQPGRLQEDDYISLWVSDSTVSAVRMRFPADRTFVFQIEYSYSAPSEVRG